MKCQTDEFLPRPATPPYIPKKTGIDEETQIYDYDLFDFDREVRPILNVVTTKTLEQALLEVEEEEEVKNIQTYKEEFQRRKHQEREDWEQEVKKELSRMNHKNKMLRMGKEKQARSIEAMHKLQALNIAKSYLSNTFVNSLQWLSDNSFWRNTF